MKKLQKALLNKRLHEIKNHGPWNMPGQRCRKCRRLTKIVRRYQRMERIKNKTQWRY